MVKQQGREGTGVDGLEIRVSQIEIQAIFYSGLAAPIVMGLFWRWWRSELGWSIIAKTLALSLALLGAMLIYWFGPVSVGRSEGMQWFTLVMLAAIPVIIWWRVLVIWKTQRYGARHRLPTPPQLAGTPP
jgi:hypothetical protein